MQQPHIFNHVDLRVRDRDRAVRFYDALLGALGLVKRPGEIEFVSYGFPGDAGLAQWFGFTVDPAMQPGQTRISLNAGSRAVVDRLAEVARTAGALHCEPPHEAYGPHYLRNVFRRPGWKQARGGLCRSTSQPPLKLGSYNEALGPP